MTTYTLNIQQQDPAHNTQKNLSITTDDAQDLMRLLQLSGVPDTDASPQVEIMAPCDVSAESAMQTPAMLAPMPMMEQQAEYDYGHRDPTDEQDEFSITDYNFRGRADLPERLTSARFGSNPLKNEMKEQAYKQLLGKYEQFLNEARENEAGEMSPLTDDNREEFAHDPQAGDTPVTDGSRSPLSSIVRQEMPQ